MLLKQEGGGSLTAAPGPASLTGASLCIQRRRLVFGFASEKLGNNYPDHEASCSFPRVSAAREGSAAR